MTAHVHHPSAADESRPGGARPTGGGARTSTRPRWLLPALGAGTIAAALVVAGVLSFSSVLYLALFGGMFLMHAGGHGGHGSQDAGHDAHGAGKAVDAHGLRQHSSDFQPSAPDSDGGLDARVPLDRTGSETHDHVQHSSHSCH